MGLESEQDFARALGVEIDASPEAVGPEEAPAAEAEPEGEEAQEAAEPAEEEKEETVNTANSTQSAEDDSRYAAARRRAEAEAKEREEKMRAEFDEKIAAARDQTVRDLGLKDDEGKPFESLAAYREYQAKKATAELDRELRRTGLNRDIIDQLVSAHPKMKQLDELEAFRAAQLAKEEAEREAYVRKRIDEDIAEIGKLDPSIINIDTRAEKMTGNEKFRAAVSGGATLLAAYREANEDAIIQREAAAKARAMENNARAKEHLQPPAARGISTMKPVPADVRAEYKRLCPWMNEEDISRHYNANTKKEN